MAKTSIFTWSDYRSSFRRLLDRPEGLTSPVLLGLVAVQTLAVGLSVLVSRLGGFTALELWPMAGWGFGSVLLLGLQIYTLMLVRRVWGGGPDAGWREGWEILRSWTSLAAGLVPAAILFSVPSWLPSLALGLWEGASGTPGSPGLAVLAPWKPVQDVVQLLLYSLLGAFYLWTFPAAAMAPRTRPSEVHRWARTLSWKTWPLAAGFAVFSLGSLVGDSSSLGNTVWMVFQAVVVQGFVFAQAALLAGKTRRTGPLV